MSRVCAIVSVDEAATCESLLKFTGQKCIEISVACLPLSDNIADEVMYCLSLDFMRFMSCIMWPITHSTTTQLCTVVYV
jgi:hypothetical protein